MKKELYKVPVKHLKEYHTSPSNEEDIINKPNHYHKNGIDVIAFAEAQLPKEQLKGFYRMNIWKYTARYEDKNGLEDLYKSRFYLDKLIDLEKEMRS